jgi:hypothetical protein
MQLLAAKQGSTHGCGQIVAKLSIHGCQYITTVGITCEGLALAVLSCARFCRELHLLHCDL